MQQMRSVAFYLISDKHPLNRSSENIIRIIARMSYIFFFHGRGKENSMKVIRVSDHLRPLPPATIMMNADSPFLSLMKWEDEGTGKGNRVGFWR